jgi:hypothetical protein
MLTTKAETAAIRVNCAARRGGGIQTDSVRKIPSLTETRELAVRVQYGAESTGRFSQTYLKNCQGTRSEVTIRNVNLI